MQEHTFVFYMKDSGCVQYIESIGIVLGGFVLPILEDCMPQAFIDFGYVKEHASFEPILAHYNLQLLGRGKDRAVLCPFHRERKPSCKIELERRVFHCFGCEAKGNLLEFVVRMEGNPKDLRAAAIKIALICSIATAPPRDGAG